MFVVLNIAYGTFGKPDDADLLLTVSPEDFLNVYSGNASVSMITRMIFRGRISVWLHGGV